MKALTRKLILTAAMLAALPAWAAMEIKGVKFNDTYQVGTQSLQLNGAGVRVKVIINVYAAGLYVGKKDHAVAGILGQAGGKSVQIVLLRDLTGEDFAEAMLKGFTKNNSEAELAKYQARLDDIQAQMKVLGTVKKGTSIHIDYVPGAGTRVLIEGAQKGTDLSGEDFYSALLKIWLGNHPVDSELKDELLGGK